MMKEKPGYQIKTLIPETRIRTRLTELAQQLNYDYQGKEVTAICVLKGTFVFFSDLIRLLEFPLTCEFLGLSSYGNETQSSGEVKVTLDINEPLEGRHVLVFEDIVDTGLTLDYILSSLRARRPESLKVCTLLQKPESMKVDLPVDYVGFKMGDEFVIGYGVDYAEKYRGLPYIGCIENEH